MPIATESGLRSRAWVEGNRRRVDALSGGKLAYVYVPNTGNPGYTPPFIDGGRMVAPRGGFFDTNGEPAAPIRYKRPKN